jgi:hypothetical protein
MKVNLFLEQALINCIKIIFKAIRMKVNLFLEQALIILVTQFSRLSVLTGIKWFGSSNNRECSAVDHSDRVPSHGTPT